jgi:hypothetical protein
MPWRAIGQRRKKPASVFFSGWKNADADLPVTAEAEKEYA